jgi:hypothetical protein
MTVHTRPEIERLLRQRLVPRTDNREALIELGFSPAYPHLARDRYYGAIWTRAIDTSRDSTAPSRANAKTLVVERAFHVSAKRRSRRVRWRRAALCGALATRSRTYSPLSARRFVRIAQNGNVAAEGRD